VERTSGSGFGVEISVGEGRKGRIGVNVVRRVIRLGRERRLGGSLRTVVSVARDLQGHFSVCPNESEGM